MSKMVLTRAAVEFESSLREDEKTQSAMSALLDCAAFRRAIAHLEQLAVGNVPVPSAFQDAIDALLTAAEMREEAVVFIAPPPN